MINVLYATLIVGAVGLVLGAVLSLASKFLYVEEDERIAKITELLPGANCGGCGFAGCANYADAIVTDGKPANCCPSCSQEAVDKISEILGIETIVAEKKIAYVKCNGGNDFANKKYEYYGMNNCEAAARLLDGFIECKYGCLGFGNCVSVCPVNAISIIDGVAVINEQTCIGCGNCVKTCPKSVISMIPADSKVRVRCSSHDKGAVTKKNCVSGCLGCKICEKTCEVGAVKVIDNVAVIDFSLCTQCGKCVEKCPKNIIKFN